MLLIKNCKIFLGIKLYLHKALFTLVGRIGDVHCQWSLMYKMLCRSEKSTIDRG